jgi:hypothetical protein
MPLSNRTKRLLDWWQLRISSTRNKSEVEKENVNTINNDDDINTSNSMGNRGGKEVNDNSSTSNNNS